MKRSGVFFAVTALAVCLASGCSPESGLHQETTDEPAQTIPAAAAPDQPTGADTAAAVQSRNTPRPVPSGSTDTMNHKE